MTEQDRDNIQSGYAAVFLDGVPVSLRYKYNMENGDVEKLAVFVTADNRELNDIADLVWPRFEHEITAAIEEDVYGRV